MIPANSSALIAYYLGIFSFLFCLLGIPAIILGFKGLAYAEKFPQAKGKVHAWVGIICGLITTLGGILLFLGICVATI